MTTNTNYVIGVGPVPANRVEYTTGSVKQIFQDNIEAIQAVFNTSTGSLTGADYDNLIAALNNLKTVAANGQVDPISGQTFYLTAEMTISLNLLIESLQAAGIPPVIPPTSDPTKIWLLQGWQSLASFGVADILKNSLIYSVSATRTLQSLLQLEYVKAGNDYLSQHMVDLANALSTTQGVLNSLGVVQNVSNQIAVPAVGDLNFPPVNDAGFWTATGGFTTLAKNVANRFGQLNALLNNIPQPANTFVGALQQEIASVGPSGSIDNLTGAAGIVASAANSNDVNYEGWYRIFASAHFTQVIPIAQPTSTSASDLLAAKQQLMQEVVILEQQNPSVTRTTPGSLAYFVYQVALSISSHFSSINTSVLTGPALQAAYLSAVSQWIIDNQDQKQGSVGAAQAGAIQNKISQAVTAAQSLNDQQKANVNLVQFTYQQFVQSASDALSTINGLVSEIARAMSR